VISCDCGQTITLDEVKGIRCVEVYCNAFILKLVK